MNKPEDAKLQNEIVFLKWQHSENRKKIRERKAELILDGKDPAKDIRLQELQYRTAKITADIEFAKLQLLKKPEDRVYRGSIKAPKKENVDFERMMRSNYNKFAGKEI